MIRTAIVCSLVAVLAACGNGTTGGGNGGGGNGGGSTGNGSESTGTTIPGLIVVPCNKPSDKTCTIHGDDTQSGADSDKQACTSDGGTVVDHCPTDGLQGCCIIAGVGECYYDAATASAAQGACGSNWTTTPP
jgi:hypothetical protein